MNLYNSMFLKKRQPKIFCIGENKTGTTSLKKYFIDHGYKVGDQVTAEKLINDYVQRNWKPIIEYCYSAQFFQDVPFSNDFLYVVLDSHFPNSKFILTERSNSEEWYNSLVNFHIAMFGKNGMKPTKADLQQAKYRVKNFIWESYNEKFDVDENDIYNKERLIKNYENRNNSIKKYFKNRNNFLSLNLSDSDTIQKLNIFLNIKSRYNNFPWENRTAEIIKKNSK